MGQIICNGTEVKTLIYNGTTIAKEGYTVEQYNAYGTERYNAGYSDAQYYDKRNGSINIGTHMAVTYASSTTNIPIKTGETINIKVNQYDSGMYYSLEHHTGTLIINNTQTSKSYTSTSDEVLVLRVDGGNNAGGSINVSYTVS